MTVHFIETQRLLLRAFSLEDTLQFYRNFASDDINLRYFSDLHYSFESTETLLRTWAEGDPEEQKLRWAITLKSNAQVIGLIVLKQLDDAPQQWEVSFGIGSAFWHRGYMTEALAAVLNTAIQEIHLERIISICNPLNRGAARVMEKCGMVYSGYVREIKHSKETDFCLYCFEPTLRVADTIVLQYTESQ